MLFNSSDKRDYLLCIFLVIAIETTVLFIMLSIFGVNGTVRRVEIEKLDAPVIVKADAIGKTMRNISSNLEIELGQLLSADNKNELSIQNLDETTIHRLADFLQATTTSGIFLILNNEENLQEKTNLIYLRDKTPNAIHNDYTNLELVYGDKEKAASLGIKINENWKKSIFVNENSDFYNEPLTALNKIGAEHYKDCGFWSDIYSMSENDTKIMTYTLPIVIDGLCVGIIGTELSMNFLQTRILSQNIPYETGIITMLCADSMENIPIKNCFFSSGSTSGKMLYQHNTIDLQMSDDLTKVFFDKENYLLGKAKKLYIYDEDNYFKSADWYIIGLVEESELFHNVYINKLTIIIVVFFVFCGSACGVCLVLKRIKRLLSVMSDNIDRLKKDVNATINYTDVPQLDDMVNCFREEKEERLKVLDSRSGYLFEEFLGGFYELTATERRILQLYLKHFSAKEVAEKMFISANTIKVHNKHIYIKLGISSMDELCLYTKMLEKSNAIDKIIKMLE